MKNPFLHSTTLAQSFENAHLYHNFVRKVECAYIKMCVAYLASYIINLWLKWELYPCGKCHCHISRSRLLIQLLKKKNWKILPPISFICAGGKIDRAWIMMIVHSSSCSCLSMDTLEGMHNYYLHDFEKDIRSNVKKLNSINVLIVIKKLFFFKHLFLL